MVINKNIKFCYWLSLEKFKLSLSAQWNALEVATSCCDKLRFRRRVPESWTLLTSVWLGQVINFWVFYLVIFPFLPVMVINSSDLLWRYMWHYAFSRHLGAVALQNKVVQLLFNFHVDDIKLKNIGIAASPFYPHQNSCWEKYRNNWKHFQNEILFVL